MTETIRCRGNRIVEIIDDDHWMVPRTKGGLPIQTMIDFTMLPAEVRPWWRAILRESYPSDSPVQAYGIWITAMWFNRFLVERAVVTTHLDSLTETDWGVYAQWLGTQTSAGRPLSHDYRRGQFVWLAAAIRHAIHLGFGGVSRKSLVRLKAVSRRAFRGNARRRLQRLAKRTLPSEQYTDLYAMMAEEWQRYLDGNPAADLPTLVACWLAFNDGVRSAEINTLVVADVLPDEREGGEKHRLRAHAPNKEPDMVPIEKDTLTLLNALIEQGKATRTELETDRLFVSAHRGPHIATTSHLNRGLRAMVKRYKSQGLVSLPDDLQLPDGRPTFGTHLARAIGNREFVRRIMRHKSSWTTEALYLAIDKLGAAGAIARALRGEALRLTVSRPRPIVDLSERPDQVDIVKRNPGNATLEYGNCGLDVERQGDCRRAAHCFECPLLVPWVSKRANYVNERDEYLRLAEQATNERDRENRLYHANLAQAYILLIDRRLDMEKEKANGSVADAAARGTDTAGRRRPRRPRPAVSPG